MGQNRIVTAAFGLVCCLSTFSVVLASTGDGAQCGKTNCSSTLTIRSCYACCVTNCTDATGCQDWCDNKLFPAGDPSNP
ncbi:MAG: hypothetical protein KF902_01040 [Phycisphaeraceae bacterium]|nr:hypothetical protein [Phycisphaeraceae bacterium]MCW5767817.1 hypothetical protein [Phycisphaeraceae bacterium]